MKQHSTENRSHCTGFDNTLGVSRREALSRFGHGLGAMALATLLNPREVCGADLPAAVSHLPAKAKRIIFLFQAGAPSQIESFDFKPVLSKRHGEQLPASVRMGQRLTGMSVNQSSLPLVGSPFKFAQHGQGGAWVSEQLPHTAKIVDELCFIKSVYTEAINHGPGVTFMQTGSQFPGRPSMGAWLSYGLGSHNKDLPTFVVMETHGQGGQPLASRMWGSGFLPSKHDGVRLRSDANVVLYLKNPEGIDPASRRKALNLIQELHRLRLEETSDPALETRIAQYEMAYRMQTSVPEVVDFSNESESTLKLYGDEVHRPGSFAANCLLARRMAERGVRFIQLFHRGWDQHFELPKEIREQAADTDQPSAALIADLKQRGMFDDTLIIWGGEFGRTIYSQGKLTPTNHGRDHHGRCFTIWMAGAGIKRGYEHGQTDDYCYNIVKDPMHIRDLNATILHLLGIDHQRFTFPYQGLDQRLTGVEPARVVHDLIA